MPVMQCPNGKWRIGNGECIYDTKEKADAAYRGYLFKKEHETQSFADKRFDEDILKKKLGGKNEK